MKINPCFECICNPLCRLKRWSKALIDCTELQKTVREEIDDTLSLGDIINYLDDGKIFEKKFLE